MEQIAGAIDHHHRGLHTSDPWAGHPIAPQQTVINRPVSAQTDRMLYRTLTLGMWLEGFQVALLLLPVVLTAVCCGWLVFR